jgi:hypothetical protein
MLAIEPNQSLLPVILLIVGFAVFVGTLISVWQNRHDVATRRAAKMSSLISLAVGLAAFAYWAAFGNEPMVPLAVIAIPLFFMAPTFVIGYYLSSAWYQRSDAGGGQT